MELETIYSAALERDYIRSQQRSPQAVVGTAPTPTPSAQIRAFLSQRPGWWTVAKLAQALGMDRRIVVQRVNALVFSGHVKRQYPPIRGRQAHAGQVQGYRWISLDPRIFATDNGDTP
jgi:hypothetical protein